MRRHNLVATSVLILFLLQACTSESEDVNELLTETKVESNASTTVSELTDSITPIDDSMVASTTQFDYSKIDYGGDEPGFLYDDQDASKLSTNWRIDLLAELRVKPPDFQVPYVREEWGPGWIDEDRNCINTRHEVLFDESLEDTTFDADGCKVVGGEWYDYFSDSIIFDPSELDIDHMVPLANAHVSGAANWPLETKISFYNDLNDPQHLIAVTSSANRSKGAKGPEVWRPPNEDHWCQYAYSWIEIKARWNLSVTESEFYSLEEMLDSCEGLPELTYWFSNWLLRKGAMSEQDMAITEKEEEAETEISTNSNDPLVEEISTESVLEYEGLELLDQSPVLSPGVNEIWVRQVVEGIEVDRMAILHVPETLEEGESYPLVFAFHGNGGEAWTWVEELSDLVNNEKFIGVYPQGHFDSWNMGAEQSKADDVSFVSYLLTRVSEYPAVSTDKPFALGVSNGGGMALMLASRTDLFNSVASIVTHLWESEELLQGLEATSVMQLSGMEDDLIPYYGGKSPVGHTFLSAEDSAYKWAEKNSCESIPEISVIFEEEGVKRWRWNDCANNARVEHYAFPGMGHGIAESGININSIIFDFFDFGKTSIKTNNSLQYDSELLPIHNYLRDAVRGFSEPEHNPANLHDPSKVVEIDGLLMTAVSGKEHIEDPQNYEQLYNCGLETWYMYPEKNYFEPGQCVLSEIPDWASQIIPDNLGSYWAPGFLDERTLFYTIAVWDNEGAALKNEAGGACIGVITASGTAPNLKWTDSGAPVTCSRLGEYNDLEPEPEAIDAAAIAHNGKEYVIYGGGHIYALEIDPVTKQALGDLFWDTDDPYIHHLANGPNIDEDTGEITDEGLWVEAAYMEQHEEWFYLFVNWYSCCRGPESTYEIRVGRSKSPTGPFVDKQGTDLRDFGGSLLLDLDSSSEKTGPGHAGLFTFKESEQDVTIMTFHYYPTDWNIGDWEQDPLSDWTDGVWNSDTSASPWSYIGARELIWENGWPVLSTDEFDFQRYWNSQ